MKKSEKLPGVVYLCIGVSIMLLVFRYIFWAEFSMEMDIFSMMFPGFTLGLVYGLLWKRG